MGSITLKWWEIMWTVLLLWFKPERLNVTETHFKWDLGTDNISDEASDSLGYEVGSIVLTGNYRNWRSVRNSSSLTSDPHWSEMRWVNGLKIASTSVSYIKRLYFIYSRDRLKEHLHSKLVLFLYWMAHVEFPISESPQSFSNNFVSEMYVRFLPW